MSHLLLEKSIKLPETALKWRQELYHTAERLSTFPDRFGYAREDDLVPETIRQFLYRPCRVLYTVTDDAVYVLHVRHAARRDMSVDEFTGR